MNSESELRRIFGETDETPEAPAFIRCDGSDLVLDRTLCCSACGSTLVDVQFPVRIRSRWRRDFLHDLEFSIRLRMESCPTCNSAWSQPPLGGV